MQATRGPTRAPPPLVVGATLPLAAAQRSALPRLDVRDRCACRARLDARRAPRPARRKRLLPARAPGLRGRRRRHRRRRRSPAPALPATGPSPTRPRPSQRHPAAAGRLSSARPHPVRGQPPLTREQPDLLKRFRVPDQAPPRAVRPAARPGQQHPRHQQRTDRRPSISGLGDRHERAQRLRTRPGQPHPDRTHAASTTARPRQPAAGRSQARQATADL